MSKKATAYIKPIYHTFKKDRAYAVFYFAITARYPFAIRLLRWYNSTMTTYLIDYENVKNLKGIKELSADDRVVIFYSDKANSLTFETHREILSSAAQIEYKFVTVGSQNALDFQLSSYLGYLINTDADTNRKYVIVSQDKGFKFVASFWESEKNLKIALNTNLGGTQQISESENVEPVKQALRDSAVELSEKDINKIADVTLQFKTKQGVNSGLMKYFKDGEKVSQVSKVIKPFIKNKK